MKIRLSFVSNSSSSSFVAIIDPDAYKEALKVAHKYTKAIVKALGPKKVTVAGTDLIVISTYLGQGGSSSFDEMELDYDGEIPKARPQEKNESDEDYEHIDEMYPGEAFDEFLDSIPKNMIHQHTDYN